MSFSAGVLASDRARLVAVIDPDVTVASTVTSDWVPMGGGGYNYIMAVVLNGTLGSSATVDAKLEQATSSGGAGAKDITDKSITQLTQAGTDASDKQAIINCHSGELDVANLFNHVRLSVAVAVATSDMCGFILGFDALHGVEADLASVDEIVA